MVGTQGASLRHQLLAVPGSGALLAAPSGGAMLAAPSGCALAEVFLFSESREWKGEGSKGRSLGNLF